jgi:hypothetical protein
MLASCEYLRSQLWDLAIRLSEVVVQANLVGFTAKQDRRAKFVLGVTLGLEDVLVAKRAQDVILVNRPAFPRCP